MIGVAKYGILIRIIKGNFLFFNFAIGFNHPPNSFSAHQFYFFLNYPQRVNDMQLFKGIKLNRVWGNKFVINKHS